MDLCWQSNVSAFEHALELPSKEEMSFNFMAAVTICSDFGAPKNKAQALWLCQVLANDH